jgi:hypothetical protein
VWAINLVLRKTGKLEEEQEEQEAISIKDFFFWQVARNYQ